MPTYPGTKPDVYVSVWYDSTSDDHGWIVDRCDEDDNSETVRVFASERKARTFARKYAKEKSLELR